MTGTELIGMAKATGETTAKDVISTPRLPSMDESWLMQELRQRQVQIIAEPQSDKWWGPVAGLALPDHDGRVLLFLGRAVTDGTIRV